MSVQKVLWWRTCEGLVEEDDEDRRIRRRIRTVRARRTAEDRVRSVIVVPRSQERTVRMASPPPLPPPRSRSRTPPPPPPRYFSRGDTGRVERGEWGLQGAERRIGPWMRWDVVGRDETTMALEGRWKGFTDAVLGRMEEARTTEDARGIWGIIDRETEELKNIFIQEVFRGLEKLRDAGKLETNRKAGSFQTLKGGFRYLLKGMVDDVRRGVRFQEGLDKVGMDGLLGCLGLARRLVDLRKRRE